jgi:hypothetical protein
MGAIVHVAGPELVVKVKVGPPAHVGEKAEGWVGKFQVTVPLCSCVPVVFVT